VKILVNIKKMTRGERERERERERSLRVIIKMISQKSFKDLRAFPISITMAEVP
jgi:hypothetical protein